MTKLDKNEPCPHCGRFSNRGVSIDAVIFEEGKILLIKRGSETEPFYGYWGTPGGFVEWDESAEDTAKREVEEETGLKVKSLQQIGTYSSPDRHVRQVINILYLAEVEPGEPKAGDDAAEAKWFGIDEVPDKLAFDHAQNIADVRKYLDSQK